MIDEDIYRELIEVARAGETCFYSAIAPLAGLDMAIPKDRPALGLILDEINRHEHGAGRPLLSAVVVLKHEGVPSLGFFDCARQLHLHTGLNDDGFWVEELQRVYDYWSRR